jgi:hypothetical protein
MYPTQHKNKGKTIKKQKDERFALHPKNSTHVFAGDI